ncbi:MAG: hypothetical protein K9J13_05800 [Saprospiraceae bacterium]|nr:hypothetical protein [Saprospiraceae bacterium]
MNKITKLFFTLIIITISFSACNPDEEEPLINSNELFVGTWLAEESSTLFPNQTFTVKITANPLTENEVYIQNFYLFGNDAVDRVTAITTSSTITINSQTVCNSVINGEGTLAGNKISWSYYVNDGADIDHVTGTYTKQ